MSDLDKMWEGADVAFLHIYGQYQWHHPATIKGNRLALTALRDAIDAALSGRHGQASVFATDGEGYSVDVHCTEVVSVIGTPEYLYALEFKMGEQAARRPSTIAVSGAPQIVET